MPPIDLFEGGIDWMQKKFKKIHQEFEIFPFLLNSGTHVYEIEPVNLPFPIA